MTEQPLDLRSSLRALGRSRSTIGALVLIGAILGVVWGMLSPVRPRATALVLLPPSPITSTGTPARDMKTQVAVGESAPVLSAAASHLSPPSTARHLKTAIRVSAVSADVLSFRATAPTPARAAQIANGVANSYIQYVNSPVSFINAGSLAALQAQAASLNSQLQGLQAQVNSTQTRLASESPSSAVGQRDASLLGALNTEQQAVSVELNNVTSQVIQDQAGAQVGTATTHVLQTAQVSNPAQLTHLAETGAEIAGAGLILGCIVALVRARRDRTLRRRVDIATAAGAPMLASLRGDTPKTVGEWAALLRPGGWEPSDSWSLRQLFQSLALDSRTARPVVELIAFADDGPSLSVAPRMAGFAASCGTTTRLEVDSGSATEKLRAACSSLERTGVPANLQLAFRGWESEDGSAGSTPSALPCKLTIRCRVAEPAKLDLAPAGADAALLVVAPGVATADQIAAVALRLDERGEHFDGTVIVNPDPTDDTAGLPQHLATPAATEALSSGRLDRETTTSERDS